MLAQATGSYRERPVSGPLLAHFSSVWVHQLPEARVPPIVIVPDGCIDLQWIDGTLRVAGPDREPQTEALAAGVTIIGFRFRPGAAAAWLGVPVSEILNGRVALQELWGSRARRLAGVASGAG